MVPVRHLSIRKTRFSCKKIAFLELQRFQRLEYACALTRRKRLERALFLPEVKDEVGKLSSESVQRILCQGSPFHFSKVLVKEESDSLASLLFGNLVSVKRLGSHDLVVFLSLLTKLSVDNYPLLSRILDECVVRFHAFTLAEVTHIAFHICDLPECLKYTFRQRWMPRVLFLLRQLDLSNFGAKDYSTLAKLTYTLLCNAPQEEKLLFDLLSVFPLCGNIEDGRSFSRDCGLVCSSMLRSDTVNYDFLRTASEFFASSLSQHVGHIIDQLRMRSTYSQRNVIFSLSEPLETSVNVDDLLLLLNTCDHFGYHNKALLDAFNRYVECSLEYFVSCPRSAEHYRQHPVAVDNQITQKYTKLLRSQRYKRPDTGKQDLPRLLNDLVASLPREREGFWGIGAIYTIGSKYICKRKSFATFLNFVLCNIRSNTLSTHESAMLRELCLLYMKFHPKLLFHLPDTGANDSSTRSMEPSSHTSSINNGYKMVNRGSRNFAVYCGPNFNTLYSLYIKEGGEEVLRELREMLRAIACDIPEIFCWKSIWQALHIIQMSRCVDMLPFVRSFLEECFLGFQSLEEPIDHACSITSYVMANLDSLPDVVLCLDSCTRIVELLSTSELSRDYGSMRVFGNLFELFVTVNCNLEGGKSTSDDVCAIMEQLSSTLLGYLMEVSRVKHDMFALPVPKLVYLKVTQSIAKHFLLHGVAHSVTAEQALELLQRADQSDRDKFLRRNVDIIRHIVFHGTLASD